MSKKKNTDHVDDMITEIAHVIWYSERGKGIADEAELGKAWGEEHAEVRGYVINLLAALEERGIGVGYEDVSKSLFAKK